MKSIKNILGIKKNDGVSSSTLDKGKKKKSNVPRTSQQTIPYRMAYDDGIIETYEGKYTRTIMFDDINYQVARQEDRSEERRV
ncbi:MAG: hypothetical protein PHI90_08485, partial [Clostridia bacterium]|nr:hypothetical protein [Clostridia bacterium]